MTDVNKDGREVQKVQKSVLKIVFRFGNFAFLIQARKIAR